MRSGGKMKQGLTEEKKKKGPVLAGALNDLRAVRKWGYKLKRGGFDRGRSSY